MFGNTTPAEDAADAYATAQVMQAAINEPRLLGVGDR